MIFNFGAGSVRVQRKREREAEKQDYLPDKSSPALWSSAHLSSLWFLFSGKQLRCLAEVQQDSTAQNGGLLDGT